MSDLRAAAASSIRSLSRMRGNSPRSATSHGNLDKVIDRTDRPANHHAVISVSCRAVPRASIPVEKPRVQRFVQVGDQRPRAARNGDSLLGILSDDALVP